MADIDSPSALIAVREHKRAMKAAKAPAKATAAKAAKVAKAPAKATAAKAAKAKVVAPARSKGA